MLATILEKLTGKDDLERVAYKEDIGLLADYLKTRPLLFPKKPRRFLDAATLTQEQLLEMIKQDSKELGSDQIELWILDVDGKKRLPAFSSRKNMEAFSSRMSQDLNKVFSLGCFEMLLADVVKQADVDFVDLNLFSKKSWELGVKKQTWRLTMRSSEQTDTGKVGMMFPIMQQLVVLTMAAINLDGGQIFQITGYASLAYWVVFGMMMARRRGRLTRTDKILIRWGFLMLFPVSAAVTGLIWHWRGY